MRHVAVFFTLAIALIPITQGSSLAAKKAEAADKGLAETHLDQGNALGKQGNFDAAIAATIAAQHSLPRMVCIN